ncbi:hypothetical protein AB1Y20_021704 [Prymnesium parvum]|uniref:Phospholipid/glycerol acyltransferase domain-containing protein n=1 Tax=Prymnesium parvum TaxID=97485 RepID=A0AB34JJ09_PRYPA
MVAAPRRGITSARPPAEAAPIDPFAYSPARWGPGEYLRTALVGCTLLPLRLAAILGALLCAALLSACVGVALSERRPPSARARWLLQPLRLCARAVLWGAGFWRVPIDRRRCAPRAAPLPPILVAAPHSSYVDPLLLMYAELPSQLSLRLLYDVPLVGRVARAMHTIFVDRSEPASRDQARRAIRERAVGSGWPRVSIFPEGTTTNGEALIRFRAGAFEPGVAVQPVLLQYSRYPLDLNGNGPLGGLWPIFLAPLMWRNSVRVTYLAPYFPNEQEQHDAALYASNVRAAMAAELGVPTCDVVLHKELLK